MPRSYENLLIDEPPADGLQASVILPARNEEELLPSTLQALAEQNDLAGRALAYDCYEIILLINNTTDRSRQVANSFQRLYPRLRLHVIERVFDKSHAHIGHVRRVLMDAACRRLESAGGRLIISTDSDTRVAPNWIAQNIAEISRGADAVGGRIVVLPSEQDMLEAGAQRIYRYDHLYRRLVCWMEQCCDPLPYDPWPRHYQHFGASLAITPRAYRTAGRLPPRRLLEDLAFYDALIRHDIRIRHSNTVRVFTSGRMTGRTHFGLSRQLANWQTSDNHLARMYVESSEFLHHLFTVRGLLRQQWLDSRSTGTFSGALVRQISAALGVFDIQLERAISKARFFGALLHELDFYEKCRANYPRWRRVEQLEKVVFLLRANFANAQRTGTSRTCTGNLDETSCEKNAEVAGRQYVASLLS